MKVYLKHLFLSAFIAPFFPPICQLLHLSQVQFFAVMYIHYLGIYATASGQILSAHTEI